MSSSWGALSRDGVHCYPHVCAIHLDLVLATFALKIPAEIRVVFRRFNNQTCYPHVCRIFGCRPRDLFHSIHAAQVSAAFRIEVLSAVPGMSQRAVARLAKRLDEAEEANESMEIGEEMRHLTLQVHGRRCQ